MGIDGKEISNIINKIRFVICNIYIYLERKLMRFKNIKRYYLVILSNKNNNKLNIYFEKNNTAVFFFGKGGEKKSGTRRHDNVGP